ncbi:MAG: hypothetical protein K2N38_09725 [Oscillospiraceae bacterium]|nr:hypothetical protein [Oscillospiraceae bacterium]
MKNYEEMAQSVLKRRDIEIKRRRRAFLIGAPCAAAVLVGVVGIGTLAADSIKRGSYINPIVAGTDTSGFSGTDTAGNDNATANDGIGIENGYPEYTAANVPVSSAAPDDGSVGGSCIPTPPITPPVPNEPAPTSTAEIAPAFTTDIAVDYPAEPHEPDYSNPNVGDTDIRYLFITSDKDVPLDSIDGLDENDFSPYSLEQLDSFYSLRFNRLGELYPSWEFSYDKLGVYRHEENDGFMASLKIVNSRNTIDYTTENGGKVSVSAQYGKFAMPDTPNKNTEHELCGYPLASDFGVSYVYDEEGNVIGASVSAYDPTSADTQSHNAGDANPDTGDPDWSKINGYDALIVAVLDDEKNVDHYTAYINMSSYVRITAYGIDEFMFEEILDSFTK